MSFRSVGELSANKWKETLAQVAAAISFCLLVVAAVGAELPLTTNFTRPTISLSVAANLPSGTTGVAYRGFFYAGGGVAPYQFLVISGSIPAGLALSSNGTVSGTPVTAVSSSFEVLARDSSGRIGVLATQIIIRSSSTPAINISVSPVSATLGSGKTQQFQAAVQGTSNTAVVWSATAGTISSNGFFTAPAVSSSKLVSITATSIADQTKRASATISVVTASQSPIVQTVTIPAATSGSMYDATLVASGGTTPYHWSVSSGALPAGIQLNTSGTLSGMTSSSGLFSFQAKVTDAAGLSGARSLTLSVSRTMTGQCGPPNYACSRADTIFSSVPNPMPSWGGSVGINRTVIDPDFHNPIVRVTDTSLGSTDSFCTGLGGSGDVPQLWNVDATILTICDNNGRYFPIGFDPVNFRSLGPLYGAQPIFTSGPGVFSHSDPNLFYALKKGQLFTINYSNRSVPPVPQLLYDFHNCGVPQIGWQSAGGTDVSDTMFSAGFSTQALQGTGFYVAVYNFSQKVCFNLNTSTGVVTKYPGATVVGRINIPDRFYIHNVKMKGSNALVVAPQNCIASCGASPYAWIIGSTQMYGLGAPKGGGHWAVGCNKWLNQPGDLYLYNVSRDFESPSTWNPVWSASGGQCGNAPLMSCTAPFDSHPAWIGGCSDSGMVFMATVVTNGTLQYPYQNEIIGITTDGSNKQFRFAHTYSSITIGNFDAEWSIGQPSPDGRFYAWTTTAGGQFGCMTGTSTCTASERRSDVLVVKLQ